MQGFRDLLGSERGVFSLLVFITSIAFVVLRLMDIVQWIDLIKFVVGALLLTKTVTGSVHTLAHKPGQAQGG